MTNEENNKENMETPHEMKTLSGVLNSLQKKGIETEFLFEDPDILKGFGKNYKSEDLTLCKTYRFEGISDPADNVALYLFKDKDGNSGFVIDVYGRESNLSANFSEFLKKVPQDDSL